MQKQTKNLLIGVGVVAAIAAVWKFTSGGGLGAPAGCSTCGLSAMGPIADRWHSATDGPDIYPPYPSQLGF